MSREKQIRYYPGDDESPIEIIDVLMDIAVTLADINRNLIAIEAAILGADTPNISPQHGETMIGSDGVPFTWTSE